MKIAFIVDPLDKLKPYKDSSVAMMRAAQARGHQVYAFGREQLLVRDGIVSAKVTPLTVSDDNHAWYVAGESERHSLTAFDAVLMRQDPPFDGRIRGRHLDSGTCRRPRGRASSTIRAPSGITPKRCRSRRFPQFTPTTLVARDSEDVQAFIDEIGDTILKPLDGMGGTGIFRVRRDDPNRNAIVETLNGHGTTTLMAQRYLPAISEGRQARAADRWRSHALQPGAHSQGG